MKPASASASQWLAGSAPERTARKPELHAARRAAPEEQVPADTTIRLDEAVLRRHRIAAFDPDAPPSRHYDLLRDQIVHARQPPGGLVVAVTAAASGNGATVTAANLAFTFARNPAHRVMLIARDSPRDWSLHRYLGLTRHSGPGGLGPAAGEAGIDVAAADVGLRLVCPAMSARDTAQALINLARAARDKTASVIVIDLPPLPASDVAMSCIGLSTHVVVVLATGETTPSQVQSCRSVLGRREGVHYILNKSGRHGL